MKMGIVTRNERSWCSLQLQKAMRRRNITPLCFRFRQLVARVGYRPKASVNGGDLLQELSALIVRPIGRGSLEEIIFRMDLLYRLQRSGMLVVNPPLAIERSVDKYRALTLLEERGLPVPRTAVTESYREALKAFHELGGDVVVKPLFGSRGVGSTRVSDPEVADRIFRALAFQHEVLYLQEFIPHGNLDIRAFVVGGRVVASMYRVARGWKTNISRGAKPVPARLSGELERLAVEAAEVLGCEVAGVDILESEKGPYIVEVNSQPGWRGLQSVAPVNIADEIVGHILSRVRR